MIHAKASEVGVGGRGGGGDQPSKRSISQTTPDAQKDNGRATYVEWTEIRAVRIKCLIVESGKLLSDSVDVCHGFFRLVGRERE